MSVDVIRRGCTNMSCVHTGSWGFLLLFLPLYRPGAGIVQRTTSSIITGLYSVLYLSTIRYMPGIIALLIVVLRTTYNDHTFDSCWKVVSAGGGVNLWSAIRKFCEPDNSNIGAAANNPHTHHRTVMWSISSRL